MGKVAGKGEQHKDAENHAQGISEPRAASIGPPSKYGAKHHNPMASERQ